MLGGLLAKISGKTVYDFEHSLKADTPSFSNSQMGGGTGRRIGNKDWSGSYNAQGHTPVLLPGETGTIIGDMGNAKGIEGPIIVDEVTIKWDIEGGKIIENSTKFSGTGAWTIVAVTSLDDATLHDAPTSIGCIVESADVGSEAGTWDEVEEVRTIELTIKRANPAGAHSGSAGFMNRRMGPMDASVALSLYFDDPATLYVPNTEKALRLYVNATEYWELLWVMFGELSGWKEDIQTGALVGVTMNGGFDGLASQTVLTLGSIITPGLVTIWPVGT